MTPVPIQPTRVLPGSAFTICMAFPSRQIHGRIQLTRTRHAGIHRRKRRFPRPTGRPPRHMLIPKLKAPVVLVHGLMGYDRLSFGRWTFVEYFRGIREALEAAGNRVLVPRLSRTAGVAQRA